MVADKRTGAAISPALAGGSKEGQTVPIVAGTKVSPSSVLPMNAVLSCVRQSFGLTGEETAPRGEEMVTAHGDGGGGGSLAA
jgi:hypothetical protein